MAHPGEAAPEGCSSRDTERRRFFEAELRRLTDRLYGVALRLTRNPADAEDLVAEAVAKAWSHLDELREPLGFGKWIMRILTNTFISAWRHRRCQHEVVWENETASSEEESDEDRFSLFEKLHQPFLLWWSTPEHALLNKLLREDLEKAIDSLPDEYRLVVVLIDLEGYAYAEAAELLHVPVGTVRSRLNRARGRLQRTLWRQAIEAGLLPHTAPHKE
ncbi:sigma-70 family RNA polymerase sigma factor [Pelomicrobium sp.]|mgnify:CR=1 FL=1|jgi:RNA polymerase sigma-70 factor (ECF subfamily)|uniref:sigma-70 family RNA polymerase sigma factor n=1 Tax=Pelomicrobium sp. TaxID=2815319 RepID=UPI002FDDB41F